MDLMTIILNVPWAEEKERLQGKHGVYMGKNYSHLKVGTWATDRYKQQMPALGIQPAKSKNECNYIF